MNQVLSFSNPGEIDPLLITTMGVNVKEGDSPIGKFGTGLKYAIAISMRMGHSLVIQSGLREFHFSTEQKEIRGKLFDFIRMDAVDGQSQTLAFTTELGKGWAEWMAYREFHCNALDEGGTSATILQAWPEPMAGLTRILTNDPHFIAIHAQPKPWLLDRQRLLLWSTPNLECFAGPSAIGYYRGIQVIELPKRSHFTYNVLEQMPLTEDRTLDQYSFSHAIASEVLRRSETPIPKTVLEPILRHSAENMESTFSWPSYITPRPEVLAMVATGGVHTALRRSLEHHLPKPALKRTRYTDLKDEAPLIPNMTCPNINALQDEVAKLVEHLAGAKNEAHTADSLRELALWVGDQLQQLMGGDNEDQGLERLRTENENLRAYAIYWRAETKALTNLLPSHDPESVPDDEQELANVQ